MYRSPLLFFYSEYLSQSKENISDISFTQQVYCDVNGDGANKVSLF